MGRGQRFAIRPEGRKRRAEAQKAVIGLALRRGEGVAAKGLSRGSVGNTPGKIAASVSPSKILAVEFFALERRADDGVERFASAPHRSLAGRPDGGERDDIDLAPEKSAREMARAVNCRRIASSRS